MKNLLAFLMLISLTSKAQSFVFEKDSAYPDQPTLLAIPNSKGFINDRALVFKYEEVVELKKYMENSGMDSTAISVLTIIEIDPFKTIEELATEYANVWELGYKKKNGILLVFSKYLKQSRIQVGESYESKFTPEVLKSIDAVMIPEFVKDDYYKGTLNALKKINEIIK